MPRVQSESTPPLAQPSLVDRRRTIVELNDQLRTTFKGGRVQMTPSVYELDARLRGRAMYAMSKFNRFDDESEHDRGVFIFAGYSFEWRIEYRGKDGTGISLDPANPERTFRVLTLYTIRDALR
jgi:Protein of unknown function (DUF3768)